MNVAMKKICTKCHKVWDLDEPDLFCPDCCGKLEVAKNETNPSVQRGLQMDNSIHRGDNIDIAGNNLSAQSIDNRTVTTNTNTTINNYQNIVDETKKVCKCELSGKMVLITDIVECPKCHRKVASQYYVDSYLMCVDCFQSANKPVNDLSPQVPIASDPVPELFYSPDPPETVNPPVMPVINNVQPTEAVSHRSSGKMVLGVIASVLIGIAAVFFLRGNVADSSDNGTVGGDEIAASEPTGPIPVSASQEKQPETAEVQKDVQSSAVTEPQPVKEEVVHVKTGADFYNSGEYVKARLLLEDESKQGNASSAYLLALMYKDGKGVTKSASQSFSQMKYAAEGGCADAYYELAEMYRLGLGTEANRAKAKQWYEQAVVSDAKNADLAAKKLNLYK